MKYMALSGLRKQKALIKTLEQRVKDTQSGVAEAASQGETTHDNAPYDALVSDLGIQNRRLCEAYVILNECGMLPYPSTVNGVVAYGTACEIQIGDETELIYIVGYGDANPETGFILYESPFARVLMGHKGGDRFKNPLHKTAPDIYVKRVFPIDETLLL